MFIFVSSSCKFVMASVSCFLIFTSFGVDGFGVERRFTVTDIVSKSEQYAPECVSL